MLFSPHFWHQFLQTNARQGRWGPKYADTPLFSGGMEFSDGGKVVENKMLNAVLEQRGFLAVFTGKETSDKVFFVMCGGAGQGGRRWLALK